jgi:plasmid stabilization system protein ParE
MTVVLREEAEEDLKEAREWYEAQRAGLGDEFLKEIGASFRRLEAGPCRYPKVHGELRRTLVRRFPFAIYYSADSDNILVVGVLHQRRSPAVWQGRTRRQ